MRRINLNEKIGFAIPDSVRRKAYSKYLEFFVERYANGNQKMTMSPTPFDYFMTPDSEGIHWEQAHEVMRRLSEFIGAGGLLPFEMVIPDEKTK